MELDAATVSTAIEAALPSADDKWQPVVDAVDPLVREHGVEAIVAELATARRDPFVAAALFEAIRANGLRMGDVFSEDEITDAALEYLLAFMDVGLDAGLADGEWAWAALWEHNPGSDGGHFADEEHLQLVLKLIERVPFDDEPLFLIGDGPLSHAAGTAAQSALIRKLAESDPKVARAWWLNVTDDGRLEP
jgi:hypothetical protein